MKGENDNGRNVVDHYRVQKSTIQEFENNMADYIKVICLEEANNGNKGKD